MEEKGVATLDRALAILAAFTDDMPCLSLAEISRRTGLYKSTLLRLLASFQQAGLIEQNDDGDYFVGVMAARLANLHQHAMRGSNLIMTAMQKLVAATSESANFYVRRNDVRVCIYCVDSPRRVRANMLLGDIFPLERGAAGKILSAFSPDIETNPELDEIRDSYFALSRGEYTEELMGLSVPVLGLSNRVEGAIALTGPISRFPAEKIASAKVELLKTAIDLTRSFGGDLKGLELALRRAEQALTDA